MRFEGFEGGQSPLQRRLPKFGFNAPNRKEFAVVNVGDLEHLRRRAPRWTRPRSARQGLVKGRWDGVKLLAEGKLGQEGHRPRAPRSRRRPREVIEKAGGSVDARSADGAQARGGGEGARGQGRPRRENRASQCSLLDRLGRLHHGPQNAITNVFRVAELRTRLAYTLALLAVYRLGIFINTPGVDRVAMNAYMQEQKAARRPGEPVQPVLRRRAGPDVHLRRWASCRTSRRPSSCSS